MPEPGTIADALVRASTSTRGIQAIEHDGRSSRLPYSTLLNESLGIAAALRARVVRIDAGLQPPTPEVLAESARQLRALAELAEQQGLRAITENWHATSREPLALLTILERCGGHLGLCADTGNAEATADKYATLAQLLPHASSVHFKARYESDGIIEMDDLGRCCALIEQAGFAGVITLIYAGKQNEWAQIGRLRAAIGPLLSVA